MLWRLFLLLVVFSFSTYADELPKIVLTSGKPVRARLLSINDDTVVFLDGSSDQRSLSPSKFVRWGSLQEPGDVDQVLLADGSLLIGRVTGCDAVNLSVATAVFGELTVPRSVIHGVIWQLPTDRLEQWRFRDSLSAEIDRGRLILKNGDVMEGRLVNVAKNHIRIDSLAGEVELRLDLIAAWQSAGTQPLSTESATMLGLTDGTQLIVKELRLDHRLKMRLVCGVQLETLPIVQPAEERLIRYLRPSSRRVAYLSDMEPIGHKHIPFLSATWDWTADRSVVGGPISSYDQLYAKGVGMHSTSRLAFDVPDGFDEFQSEVSMDRSAGKRGSVVYRVFTTRDGAKWDEAFKSKIVRGGGDPLFIQVDVRTARRLALVVDFADQADQLDRANWIGARLVKLGSR